MAHQYKHVSSYMNAFIDHLPQDQKKKVLVERKVKQVYEQFSACVDPFIAEHVNSVYLVKDEEPSLHEDKDVSRETSLRLTVYVDNSIVAAELNARRELVVLKYRELFNIKLDKLEIKISRGAYRENYPLREKNDEADQKIFHELTPEEEAAIELQTASISDEDIKASFQRVLKATKEHPLED